MDSKYVTVFCTVPDEKTAEKISKTLVEEKLAACCNIIRNIRSIYAWEGKIYDDPELLIIIKTRAAAFERIEKRIGELHPYNVPEIIALPIVVGNKPYLNWVKENVHE